MTDNLKLKADLDAILHETATVPPIAPGVAAIVVDRQGVRYLGAAGKRSLDGDQPMTADTVFAVFSVTKPIVAALCLQLMEEGRLDLDAPAQTYVPEIAEIQVIDGFDAAGRPKLRPPKRPITVRMLLLHTAGFGYGFFNATYHRLIKDHGYGDIISCTMAGLKLPLLFDPGDSWEYGLSIDWAGLVVEAILGRRLGTAMEERIFKPLGMNSSGFARTEDMRRRLAVIHQRDDKGDLKPLTGFELPAEPEIEMGGGGLYATVEDYGKFIRMWLNDGRGDHGRVLRPETIAMASRNHLGERKIKKIESVNPALSNDAEFFPGLNKTWGLSFLINEEQAPTGRPAGSPAWAGLANLYFWIDRTNGIGGFWATQIFPFFDPASLDRFYAFETKVYENLKREKERAA